MRDLFPGWVPPDEATLDRYWNEATFAVDASVLLDLYRFSEKTRTGLLTALRSFDDRLWIPHQVGLEFHRNRFGVLLAQREAEGNLLSGLGQIKEELIKQLGERLKGAGRRDLDPLREAIDAGFDRLRQSLMEAEKEHTKGLGESISEDPIYDEVADLCETRVGEPFDLDRQSEVFGDAEERFRTKTPPGYLDMEKDEDRKYGDVILWHQLLDRAEKTRKPIVLISDDQKEDWVWEERGKTLGPRPELVAEMIRHAEVGFHLYTPTRFLQMWEQRAEGREVEPEVLAELEASSHDPAPLDYALQLARRYVERAQVRQPEAGPPFLAVGGKVAQARVSHTIHTGSVNLEMELQFPFDLVGPIPAVVAIRTPDASEVLSHMYPVTVSTEGAGQTLRYSFNYPGYSGAGTLFLSGEYEAVWQISAAQGESIGSLQEVARDRFSVLGGSDSAVGS
jgi:hypothetical protein